MVVFGLKRLSFTGKAQETMSTTSLPEDSTTS